MQGLKMYTWLQGTEKAQMHRNFDSANCQDTKSNPEGEGAPDGIPENSGGSTFKLY